MLENWCDFPHGTKTHGFAFDRKGVCESIQSAVTRFCSNMQAQPRGCPPPAELHRVSQACDIIKRHGKGYNRTTDCACYPPSKYNAGVEFSPWKQKSSFCKQAFYSIWKNSPLSALCWSPPSRWKTKWDFQPPPGRAALGWRTYMFRRWAHLARAHSSKFHEEGGKLGPQRFCPSHSTTPQHNSLIRKMGKRQIRLVFEILKAVIHHLQTTDIFTILPGWKSVLIFNK